MVTIPMKEERAQDRLPRSVATSALLAVAFLLSTIGLMLGLGSGSALAQGAVRSVHGEWEIRCDTPPGAPSEQCALMQYVTAADRDNVGLTVIVLRTADKSARILRVLTPLGVLLPHGLGLKVDDTDVGRAGFVRCLPQGCIAEVIMDDKLVELMSKGSTATFIVFQTPEEGIGIPIALSGFKAGFEELK
ncbi:Invasion protein IalB, involved in pathogenesis [Cohaesibacter sp. ES.047]|uniref:invasion associated locus B family protein n=1 Tax=Cohaesibacter sp. ES.047 TaxID=1798205 RepID=UPI000BC0C542|nr:Invasion protein IalB, involved in pathogenesis [Cohaesibacter sp. ES.047]